MIQKSNELIHEHGNEYKKERGESKKELRDLLDKQKKQWKLWKWISGQRPESYWEFAAAPDEEEEWHPEIWVFTELLCIQYDSESMM